MVSVVVGAAGVGVGVAGGAAVLPFGDVVDFALSGWLLAAGVFAGAVSGLYGLA